MPITLGCVISRLTNEEGDDNLHRRDLGRVVHVERHKDRFYVIPFPETTANQRNGTSVGVRRRHHIKRPWLGCLSEYEAAEGETYLFPRWAVPPLFLLKDEEMLANNSDGDLRPTRRDLRKSMAIREAHYRMIKPIVEGASIEQLLDPTWLKRKTEARAAELGIKSGVGMIRHVRQYMLGGSNPNALLPRYDLINLRGAEKLPRQQGSKRSPKAGAKNNLTKAGIAGREGVAMSPKCRQRLRSGWKQFKVREGYSVQAAYLLTLKHYFPSEVGATATDQQWTEEELAGLPTECQFRTHGPNHRPELSASRANLSPLAYEKNLRPRVGSNRNELLAAGFAATDATSCDQNLVSIDDPTQLLMSPWETKVTERFTGYVLGWHCGFESRSSLTSLMAVNHAASDKVEYCRRYGVEISPDDWLSMVITALKADNGETKALDAVAPLTSAGISLEFVSPYRSDRNGEIETIHNALARMGSHLIAGSTEGRRKKRGDPDPIDDAAINFGQFMPLQIKAILKHNNEDLVPHLLPLEARREGVKPTRGAILKWMIQKGYVTSAVAEIPEVRTRCLPRLRATIERGMVYLKDPRDKRSARQRRVPFLRYKPCPTGTQQMIESSKNRDCVVVMNPSYVGEAWLLLDGLIHLRLESNEEELHRATLAEWLDMTDIVGIEREEMKLRGIYKEALRLDEILKVCREGRAARRAALKAQELQQQQATPKSRLRAKRREKTRDERERLEAERLGMDATANPPSAAPEVDPAAAPPPAPRPHHVLHRRASAALQAHRNSQRPVK